jgi:hypothetical protein
MSCPKTVSSARSCSLPSSGLAERLIVIVAAGMLSSQTMKVSLASRWPSPSTLALWERPKSPEPVSAESALAVTRRDLLTIC